MKRMVLIAVLVAGGLGSGLTIGRLPARPLTAEAGTSLAPAAPFHLGAADSGLLSVTLPNGVTLKLVGLSPYPPKGKTWWLPDGEECPNPLFDDSGVDIRSGQPLGEHTIEFAFAIIGLKSEIGSEVRIVDWPKSTWWAGRKFKNGVVQPEIKAMAHSVPTNATGVHLRLTFDSGERLRLEFDTATNSSARFDRVRLSPGEYSVTFRDISLRPGLRSHPTSAVVTGSPEAGTGPEVEVPRSLPGRVTSPVSSADLKVSKVLFGPEVERTVRLDKESAARVFFLDIEKGEIKTCPFPVGVPPTGGRMFDGLSEEALKRQPDLAKWIVESGVDVAFVLRRKDWGMLGMVKPGFTVDSNTSGPNTDPNAGTAGLSGLQDDLVWAEIRPPPLSGGWPVSKYHSHALRVSGSPHGPGYSPRGGYHWIHTASGSLAVLQLGELGDGVPGLKIRYKVAQGAQAKAAAESKAREALKRLQAECDVPGQTNKSLWLSYVSATEKAGHEAIAELKSLGEEAVTLVRHEHGRPGSETENETI